MQFWEELGPGARYAVAVGVVVLLALLGVRQCASTPDVPVQHARGIAGGH